MRLIIEILFDLIFPDNYQLKISLGEFFDRAIPISIHITMYNKIN